MTIPLHYSMIIATLCSSLILEFINSNMFASMETFLRAFHDKGVLLAGGIFSEVEVFSSRLKINGLLPMQQSILLVLPQSEVSLSVWRPEDFDGFFSNSTFVLLFLATALYWVEMAFFTETPSKMATVFSSTMSSSTSDIFSKTQQNSKPILSHFSKLFLGGANVLLVCLLVLRWEISGHFPLSNLYESLIFLSWCCTFLHLVFSRSFSVYLEKILGSIVAPCSLLMNGFATLALPQEMQKAAPLVPALQSNWLMMHVTVMIISYATLIMGSLLSIAFLICKKILSTNEPTKTKLLLKENQIDLPRPGLVEQNTSNSNQLIPLNASNQSNVSMNSFITKLDYLSYRFISLGFPFLTIGILSGAVWANEAWGSYWSWDPKETWALLTWFIYAIYLHNRLNNRDNLSQTENPAIIASIGFLVVWFCYLGVNLLGEGLHSYGFFNN
jgi:cytochrome c-type biogenesis protein CcsB